MTTRRRRKAPAAAQDDPQLDLGTPEPLTLAEVLALSGGPPLEEDEPVLPGFEMADEPIPTPLARAVENQRSYSDEINERAQSGQTFTEFRKGEPVPTIEPEPAPEPEPYGATKEPPQPKTKSKILHGEVMAPSRSGGPPRYESRIRILDAWQYTGAVTSAPTYVDRNWVGWGDADRLRDIPAGPCLRVPLNDAVVFCRIGDYVVHQETRTDDGRAFADIEVWEKNQFERLFLPKS